MLPGKITDALFFPPPVSSWSKRSAESPLSPHVSFFKLPPRSLISALGFQVSPPTPPPHFSPPPFFPSWFSTLTAADSHSGTLETRLGGVWTCCWFLMVNCDLIFIYWRCNIKNVSHRGSRLFFFFVPLPSSAACAIMQNTLIRCPEGGTELRNYIYKYVNTMIHILFYLLWWKRNHCHSPVNANKVVNDVNKVLIRGLWLHYIFFSPTAWFYQWDAHESCVKEIAN